MLNNQFLVLVVFLVVLPAVFSYLATLLGE